MWWLGEIGGDWIAERYALRKYSCLEQIEYGGHKDKLYIEKCNKETEYILGPYRRPMNKWNEVDLFIFSWKWNFPTFCRLMKEWSWMMKL